MDDLATLFDEEAWAMVALNIDRCAVNTTGYQIFMGLQAGKSTEVIVEDLLEIFNLTSDEDETTVL